MKLSEVQREVLRLMGEGWELGSSGTFDPRYWLQKGGLGRGGAMKDIRSTTYHSLVEKGLIEKSFQRHPFIHYKLTEKGRASYDPQT